MRRLKFLKILLLVFFVTAYSLQLTVYSLFAQDKIVAIVNNDVITQKDLDEFANFMRMQFSQELKGRELETKIQSMKLDLLIKLIDDRLILQEARKAGFTIDDARVKARIEEIKKRYGQKGGFQGYLTQHGLTYADIELKVREQLLTYGIMQQKIRNKITVNPSEVTAYYENNPQKFKLSEQREIEVLTLQDQALAEELSVKLKEGQELSELAQQHSLAVDSLTVLKGNQLREDIEKIVFGLSADEISDPVKIEEVFYIFKLNNIILPRQQTLAEAQGEIYDFLFNKKMQESLNKWLDELKNHSYIKIIKD